MSTTVDPTTNGHDPSVVAPPPDAQRGERGDTDQALAPLRARPQNVHVMWGFGSLAVGVLLFVLMVLLAPTVAPERIVEQPVGGTSTTEVTIATTTSTPATTTTAAAVAP
ncbi:MAG TPA: hypothetical protein VIR58_08590 [Acidimicrobiales bacterium]